MTRLYRVWNGGRSPQDIEFCYVLAVDAVEAARLGKAFLKRLDMLPDPELMPQEPQARLTELPGLEQKMRALGRVCTMNETGRKIPVIPNGFPAADKAFELTPEQMKELRDKYGYTTREIAELYDDLPWQRVSACIGKLKNPEWGKTGKTNKLWGKNKPKEDPPGVKSKPTTPRPETPPPPGRPVQKTPDEEKQAVTHYETPPAPARNWGNEAPAKSETAHQTSSDKEEKKNPFSEIIEKAVGKIPQLESPATSVRPLPAEAEKPLLLKPSSYQGELLQYLLSEKNIKFFSPDEELTIPKDKLPRVIDELTELWELAKK